MRGLLVIVMLVATALANAQTPKDPATGGSGGSAQGSATGSTQSGSATGGTATGGTQSGGTQGGGTQNGGATGGTATGAQSGTQSGGTAQSGVAAAVAIQVAPLRVAIECEQTGRTKACPAFLTGFIDANPILRNGPRAGADVVVYATANQVALIDRLHLRFVGSVAGAPPVLEIDVDVDTRTGDDEQRAVLQPAFLRGMAIFVGARYPQAVAVALSAPANVAAAKGDTSPWGVVLEISGNGSYTENFRSASTEINLVGRYLTRRFRALSLLSLSGGLQRQPPLELEDGTIVNLDTERWAVRFGAESIYSLTTSWAVGVGCFTNFEDPKAQFKYSNRTRAAIEWDLFAPDDPRGNRLAVFYHLGWHVDRYNIRNELGERFAQYPAHGINAVGSVRHDKVSYGLTLETNVQLDHPGRRHELTAAPFVTIQIGNHVDVNLALSITQRQLPAPDPAAIDPSDFAQQSRLSFTEPLSMTGSIGLTFHWDPTNGVRNDRLESI